jgi:DNA-binding transcriptional LysR family regulator
MNAAVPGVQCRLDLARDASHGRGDPARLGTVSLSQIEYFVAVAEHGNVGKAAGRLRVAQPAVSRQIRRLEDELGTVLFVRTPRGMRLSGAGELFLGHARAILVRVGAAKDAVRVLATSSSDVVKPARS